MQYKYRVLVIDDDPTLTKNLQEKGYDCFWEPDGKNALHRLGSERFDVSLIDLVKHEPDGLDIVSYISENSPDTACIVITEFEDVLKAIHAIQRGADDFLIKPIHSDELDSVIQRVILRHPSLISIRKSAAKGKKWEEIVDAIPDCVLVVGKDHRIWGANSATIDALGKTRQEIEGSFCYTIIHQLTEPPDYCPIRRVQSGGSFEKSQRYRKLFGTYYHIGTRLMKQNGGDFSGVIHVARNVTEEITLREQLKEAYEETEALIASLSSFLIGLDKKLNVTRWNEAAYNLFGLESQEVLGHNLASLPIDWDLFQHFDLAHMLNSNDFIVRLPHIHLTQKNGETRTLGITVHFIRQPAPTQTYLFLLGADITDRLNMEAQLVQAQKLESIGQLAAGIAHEINTPTQYVGDNVEFLASAFNALGQLQQELEQCLKSFVEKTNSSLIIEKINLLKKELDIDYFLEEIPKAIQQSREGINRIASIVLAMKEFSHPGTKEKTRADINHCLLNTITVSRNEWKYVADMETQFDPELPQINCLPSELNQVFLNIIVNAAHAIRDVVGDGSKGKGKITVSTKRVGDWIEIRISDTGTGIPKSIQNRIFEPFFTTKEVGKGTGQGLAIARNVVVDKHKGTITFETQEGKGTTFIIRLPIDDESKLLG